MARDRIWYALSRHGIEIPVATQAIRLSQHSESLETTVPAEIEQRIACLKMGGLFDALPAFQLRQLAEKNATRVYGADESIIRQGEAAASMFVVVDGQVQVTASQENTAPVLVKILHAGDFFGEMSLLTGSARVATVTALVESRILEISKQSFQAILHGQPDLVEALGLSLQSRLTEHAKAMAGAKQVVADPPDLLQKIRDLFVT
jgi:CRP-like cAMP-binding protein